MPDFQAANLTHQLTFEGNWPTAVAFTGDDHIVAGNRDGQLYLWDLTGDVVERTELQQKDGALKDRADNIHPVRRLDGHTNGVTHLLTSPDGKTLISTSLDHSVRIWDMTGPPTGQAEAVIDIAQRRRQIKRDKSNEEEVLSQPGISVETQTSPATLEAHDDWVLAAAMSSDGKRVLTGDDGGTTILWDLPARKEIRRWPAHPMNGVVSVAITADATKVLISEYRASRGSFDRPPAQAKIFAADTGELLVDLLVVKFPDVKVRDNSYGYGTTWGKWMGRGFVASAFSQDGKTLVVGCGGETGDANVYLIDARSGQEIRTLATHKGGVCDVAFTSDGQHLLSSGRDTVIHVTKTADGKNVATLHKPRGGQFKDWLSAIAISPGGNRIAAADIAGIVHVWAV